MVAITSLFVIPYSSFIFAFDPLGSKQKKSPLLRAGLRLTKTKITLLIWQANHDSCPEDALKGARDFSRATAIIH